MPSRRERRADARNMHIEFPGGLFAGDRCLTDCAEIRRARRTRHHQRRPMCFAASEQPPEPSPTDLRHRHLHNRAGAARSPASGRRQDRGATTGDSAATCVGRPRRGRAGSPREPVG